MPPPPPALNDGITGLNPRQYRLDQNSPNPFNPATSISYALPAKVQVVVRVYDLLGRVIATLVNGVEEPGEHRVRWDAAGVPGGIYFCRLTAGGWARTVKMVVMR
jgi:hypothetical protein